MEIALLHRILTKCVKKYHKGHNRVAHSQELKIITKKVVFGRQSKQSEGSPQSGCGLVVASHYKIN